MRKFNLIPMFLMLFVFILASCGTTQSVKHFEIGKVTAESILYEARTLQNKNIITEIQFETVRTVYDKLRSAQDLAIDTRIALIKYHSTDNERRVEYAMGEVVKLSLQLINVAKDLGIRR